MKSNFNLKEIKEKNLAGFLQQAIIKKVNQESWNEEDYERPLKKIKRAKVKKDVVWWWSFFRNSVEQFKP